jgi:hypothetical protein
MTSTLAHKKTRDQVLETTGRTADDTNDENDENDENEDTDDADDVDDTDDADGGEEGGGDEVFDLPTPRLEEEQN